MLRARHERTRGAGAIRPTLGRGRSEEGGLQPQLLEGATITIREQIHQLVDMLPGDELKTAGRVLAGLSALSLSNPATAALAKAALDDEPVTDREAEAITEGERDLERGRIVTAAELRAYL